MNRDTREYGRNTTSRTAYEKQLRIRRMKRMRKKQIKRRLVFLLWCVMILAGIHVLAYRGHAKAAREQGKTESNADAGQEQVLQGEDVASNQQGDVIPDKQDGMQPTDKQELPVGAYDYSQPVPYSDAVDAGYFADAVFIGDSRTEGFYMNVGPEGSLAYTYKGLMVDTVFTQPVINMNGEKLSVMDALRNTSFAKVYIMLGINETGWSYDPMFIEKYKEIIAEIKSINPDAMIYVQSILPVSAGVSAEHDYIKNEKIYDFNGRIQNMALEEGIYYLNVAESVALPDGSLPEEAAADGIHLKKEYCEKWLYYLQTHTAVR